MGSGLQKICRMYGGIVIQGERFVWDYAREKGVRESEMTKEQQAASDKAKANLFAETFKQVADELKAGTQESLFTQRKTKD